MFRQYPVPTGIYKMNHTYMVPRFNGSVAVDHGNMELQNYGTTNLWFCVLMNQCFCVSMNPEL